MFATFFLNSPSFASDSVGDDEIKNKTRKQAAATADVKEDCRRPRRVMGTMVGWLFSREEKSLLALCCFADGQVELQSCRDLERE